MWRCEWCGEEFEKPDYRGFVAVCPNCKEEDITDVTNEFEECECCGKMVKDTDMQGVCEDCACALYEIWEEAVNKAMTLNSKWDYSKAEMFLKNYFKDLWRDNDGGRI